MTTLHRTGDPVRRGTAGAPGSPHAGRRAANRPRLAGPAPGPGRPGRGAAGEAGAGPPGGERAARRLPVRAEVGRLPAGRRPRGAQHPAVVQAGPRPHRPLPRRRRRRAGAAAGRHRRGRRGGHLARRPARLRPAAEAHGHRARPHRRPGRGRTGVLRRVRPARRRRDRPAPAHAADPAGRARGPRRALGAADAALARHHRPRRGPAVVPRLPRRRGRGAGRQGRRHPVRPRPARVGQGQVVGDHGGPRRRRDRAGRPARASWWPAGTGTASWSSSAAPAP